MSEQKVYEQQVIIKISGYEGHQEIEVSFEPSLAGKEAFAELTADEKILQKIALDMAAGATHAVQQDKSQGANNAA